MAGIFAGAAALIEGVEMIETVMEAGELATEMSGVFAEAGEVAESEELVAAAEEMGETRDFGPQELRFDDLDPDEIGIDMSEYGDTGPLIPEWRQNAGAIETIIANNRVLNIATSTGMYGLFRAAVLRGEEITLSRLAGYFAEQAISSMTWYGMSHALWPGQPPHPELPAPGHKKEIDSSNFIGQYPFSTHQKTPEMFPKKIKKTLRWSSNLGALTVSHTNAAPNVATATIVNANSCKDPGGAFATHGTVDTHEPLGWTQYKAMYDNYVVTAARMRVDYFVDEPSTTDGPAELDAVCIGIALKPSGTVDPVAGHYQEYYDSVWQVAGPEHVGRLTYDFDAAKFFGVSESSLVADSALRAATATPDDPSNRAYFHIFGHHMKETGLSENATRIRLIVTVEYDVTFFEPKGVAQS